jgi:hypothetical protein
MDNLHLWQQLERPPKWALKEIREGRLKGKSDINPQWRYRAMTEIFGPVGVGWRYEIVRLWSDDGANGAIIASAHVNLYVKIDGEWSAPIPGVGGSQLVKKETKQDYTNDEGFKMATTDALSVAMKALGVAAAVYQGQWDGSKYRDLPTGGNGNGPDTGGKTGNGKKPNNGRKPGRPDDLPITEATKGYIIGILSDADLFTDDERQKARAYTEKPDTQETAARRFLNRIQDLKKFRIWFNGLEPGIRDPALSDFQQAFALDAPTDREHFDHIRRFVEEQRQAA